MRSIRGRLGQLKRGFRRITSPVKLGRLGSAEPISRAFGMDRGTAIDRRYIEQFLAEHSGRIHGRTLEVGDSTYTNRFGGSRVTERGVLHAPPGAPGATIVADLTNPDQLPKDAFDCFICTQTLNCVYDVRRAVEGARQLLRPGGSLLVTVGGISRVSRFDRERWGFYWWFTTESLGKVLADVFGSAAVVSSYGNVLGATAFLHGLAVEDLPDPSLLDADDPDYPVVVAAVAEKPR